MIRKVCLILAFAGLSLYLQAQRQVWTFGQCLDTALTRNISVNQTRLTNETNKISLKQVKQNRIPSLSAGVNENVNFGKNVDPTTNAFVVQTYNSTGFSISTGLSLFNGLQNSRTIKQYAMNVTASEYDIETAKNSVILSITTAYLQVLFSYEVLNAARQQADATGIQVDRTKKMVDAGKVPELNLFQIQSQQATDHLAVVNAETQLDLARVTLEQLMDLPVIDSFDIVVPDFPDPAVVMLQTNEQIYQKALKVRPEIAGAATRTGSALMGVKVSQGAQWPRLNFSGGTNTNFATSSRSVSEGQVNPYAVPFFTQLWDNLGASLGLNLSIPIYSNRQIKSNIDRAKINAMNVQLSEQNTKNQLRKTIEQAFTDLKSSMKKYEAVKIQLNSAQVSYQSIEQKYNVGMVNTIDYLIEKNNFFQSQSNLIQAKYDFIFKSKILDFYQGNAITM
jgi:outer membrane protein